MITKIGKFTIAVLLIMGIASILVGVSCNKSKRDRGVVVVSSGAVQYATSMTGSMKWDRGSAPAVLLNSGKVLITHGMSTRYYKITAAEEYDPGTGLFTIVADSNERSANGSAIKLADGRIVCGATGGFMCMDIYNPVTKTFTLTPAMPEYRPGIPVALSNGKVLIIGGETITGMKPTWNNKALLYSVSGNTYTYTVGTVFGTSGRSPTINSVVTLADGRVFISDGLKLPNANIIELYNPTLDSFALPANPINTPRTANSATTLNDGKVLLVGGKNVSGTYLATAEIYDPVADTFTYTAGNLVTARSGHTATLLSDGKVLIAGGTGTPASALDSLEIYDPATGLFTSVGSMQIGRVSHSATLLNNGQVLIVGGTNVKGINLSSAELYTP